ncbi:hypothetical protein [Microbacterium terrisoli]|uniref:hypothetical protein n=1 Tax=Microbacterium terrisoli TaxID=3242192 RepID=UPI002805AE5C|nr:hypothetical protein [Microbacterium protaetiae]
MKILTSLACFAPALSVDDDVGGVDEHAANNMAADRIVAAPAATRLRMDVIFRM